jgi:hypothetical protein
MYYRLLKKGVSIFIVISMTVQLMGVVFVGTLAQEQRIGHFPWRRDYN